KYLQESNKIGKIPKEQINIFAPETTKIFDDLEVHSFATSHDAAEPQYYVFCSGGKRFACLTDTGYVSSSVKMQIEAADAYLMEFNYDDMMLRNGPYSWSLKQRILSDVGHLSNEQAVEALGDVVSRETKYIFLAHI
ncbi:MAG: MBL fold metallo-hydrolase, partial [Lactobacillus iners]|nr:MBL fold metallo-hydrolase [Lactobacillus iners]